MLHLSLGAQDSAYVILLPSKSQIFLLTTLPDMVRGSDATRIPSRLRCTCPLILADSSNLATFALTEISQTCYPYFVNLLLLLSSSLLGPLSGSLNFLWVRRSSSSVLFISSYLEGKNTDFLVFEGVVHR